MISPLISSPLIAIPLALLVSVLIGCSKEAGNERIQKKADGYFSSGNYDAAMIEYRNLHKEVPQHAHAIGQIGIIWFRMGSPTQAFPYLNKAAELNPEAVEVRVLLSQTLGLIGLFDEARKEAAEVLLRSPERGEAFLVLANTSRTEEEILDAEQQIRKSMEGGPEPALMHLALASLSFKKQDQDAGERSINDAVQSDPKSARALLAMGNVHLAKSQFDKAREAFAAGSALAPPRSAERLRYAEFELQMGELGNAREALEKFTAEVSDYIPGWMLFAQLAVKEQRFSEASEHLENIFRRDPGYIFGRLLKAQIQMTDGEPEEALDELKRLRELYPKSPVTEFYLAKAYLWNATPSQARAALNRAIGLQPDYREAIILLAQLDLRAGNPEPVVTSMENELRKSPGLSQLQFILAEAYRSSGRLDAALNILDGQIEANAESFNTHLFRGMILKQQAKSNEAREAFEKAQSLSPENGSPVIQLAELDLAEERFGPALNRLREQLDRTSESAAMRFMIGRVHAVQEDWENAEKELKEAIQLDPNFLYAHSLLANVYVDSNRLPQALASLEAFVTNNSDNLGALISLGQIYQKNGESEKAKKTYEKILTLSPNSIVALNNLAWLYSEEEKDPDKAYELAQQARNQHPDNGAVADTLGWILHKRGDDRRSLALLREAATKIPDNGEIQFQIQFHLGMVSYAMGEVDEARTAFEKVLATETPFPELDQAKAHLALIGGAKRSLEDLEALRLERPKDPVILMALGQLYEEGGQFQDAIVACQQALEANPQLLTALIKLSELYAGPMEDLVKAREFAEKARAVAPNDFKVASILGMIEYALEHFERAYDLLWQSARNSALGPEGLYKFATVAYSLGKVGEALGAMTSVSKSGKASVEVVSQAQEYMDLLELIDGDGPYAPFEPRVKSSILTDPNHLAARMVLAGIEREQGEGKKAESIYLDLLGRHPKFAPAQKALASLYVTDPTKLEEAQDLAVKARGALPDDRGLAMILAEISFRQEDFGYTATLLQDLDRKGALDAQGLYFLGMSQIELGPSKQGIALLKRALKAGLPQADEERATKAINSPE